jgi:geranylgeranyl diphosphate synthase type I
MQYEARTGTGGFVSDSIGDLIKETTAVVREACRTFVREKASEELHDSLLYAIDAKGACDRSLVTRLAYQGFGGDWRRIWKALVGVELMDFAVIAIDDILDGAPRRMSKPSHPVKFGTSITICAASVLKSLGTLALLDCVREIGLPAETACAAVRVFEEDHVGIYTGQYRDVLYETKSIKEVSVDACLDMIRLTTGVQIGAMAAIGAILADAPESSVCALKAFGTEAGTVFQIRDDFIDFLSDEGTTGKTPFLDWMDGKKRYPLLLALDVLPLDQADGLAELLGKKQLTPSEKIFITKGICSTTVREAALREISTRRLSALEHLDEVAATGVDTKALRELLEIGCRV